MNFKNSLFWTYCLFPLTPSFTNSSQASIYSSSSFLYLFPPRLFAYLKNPISSFLLSTPSLSQSNRSKILTAILSACQLVSSSLSSSLREVKCANSLEEGLGHCIDKPRGLGSHEHVPIIINLSNKNASIYALSRKMVSSLKFATNHISCHSSKINAHIPNLIELPHIMQSSKKYFHRTIWVRIANPPLIHMKTDQPLILSIQGHRFPITEHMKSCIPFFQQWKALSPHSNLCTIHQEGVLNIKQWSFILELLQHFHYQLPICPKVRSTEANDYIGSYLTEKLEKMSLTDLNKLYVGCHFLKIKPLQKAIAAFLACKVYIKCSEADFEERMAHLKIKEKLSREVEQSYRQDYSFMNN